MSSALAAFTNLLGLLVLLVGSIVVIVATSRRGQRDEWGTTVAEWRQNSEAHEERVKILEARDENRQRELFDLSIKLEDVERTNKRIGRHNLALQRQVDSLQRREKQLVSALKLAGIPVPDPIDEEEI